VHETNKIQENIEQSFTSDLMVTRKFDYIFWYSILVLPAF